MPLKTTKFIWHEGRLVPVGTGDRARAEPRAALRLVRIRGHPRLSDAERRRRLPAHGPRSPPVPLREDLPDEDPVLARSDHRGVPRGRPRERCSKARTSGRSRFAVTARSASRATSSSPRASRSRRGNGARTSATARSSKASTSACRRGSESRRTRCPRSRRPAAIIFERARDARGAPARLRRRHRAQRRRLRERRRGREPVPRAERQALHAAGRRLDPVGHHARHRGAARRVARASRCSSRTFRASCCTSPTKCS